MVCTVLSQRFLCLDPISGTLEVFNLLSLILWQTVEISIVSDLLSLILWQTVEISIVSDLLSLILWQTVEISIVFFFLAKKYYNEMDTSKKCKITNI